MDLATLRSVDEMNVQGYLMYEKTYKEYVRDAAKFLKVAAARSGITDAKLQHIKTQEQLIIELLPVALIELTETESSRRTTDGWRKLRRSLAIIAAAIGRDDLAKKVTSTKNPVDWQKRPRKPGKSKRLITVTPAVFGQIFNAMLSKDDRQAQAMLVLGRELGLRPAEMNTATWRRQGDEMYVQVLGAKKTKVGEIDPKLQRGIARELIVPRSDWLSFALKECSLMSYKDMKNTMARIERMGKNLWPNQKQRFCLYSLRYTIGSNLKAQLRGDPLQKQKVAAAMGHKRTKSAGDYGNPRSGGSSWVAPRATEATIASVEDNCQRYADIKPKIDAAKTKRARATARKSLAHVPRGPGM